MKTPLSKLILIVAIFTAIACSNDEPKQNLTIQKFETSLRKEMSASQIVKTFGSPLKDVGSGIHIYVYKLRDGNKVMIGCADNVYYAHYTDSNGVLIRTII